MYSPQTINVARILRAWLDVLEHDTVEPLESLLAPDAYWAGLSPELDCQSRDEVLKQMRRGTQMWGTFTSISASADGDDDVIVSVEGPHVREGFAPELRGNAHLRFTFRDGKVVHIHAARTREEAQSRQP